MHHRDIDYANIADFVWRLWPRLMNARRIINYGDVVKLAYNKFRSTIAMPPRFACWRFSVISTANEDFFLQLIEQPNREIVGGFHSIYDGGKTMRGKVFIADAW